MACIWSVDSGEPSSKTARGLPENGSSLTVKTLTRR